jgi:uncharacterized protein
LIVLLTDILIPTFTQTLQTLLGLLDKAEKQMPDRTDILLSAKLAPDMFPLAGQVRLAAFHAQDAICKLLSEKTPERVIAVRIEGANAGNAPGSIADSKARVDEALSFIASVSGKSLDSFVPHKLVLENPAGRFELTDEQYTRDFVLPQFYFHIVTAYAILRFQGVSIGKLDFIPQMFAYLKPVSA